MQLIVQKSEPVDISWLKDYYDIEGLSIFLDKEGLPENYSGLILHCTEQGLALSLSPNSGAAPTQVDFTAESLQYRLKTSKRSEGLLKAIGLDKYSFPLNVLDVTAGLGSDAYIMAALGCNVSIVEKSAIMAALLKDAFNRIVYCDDKTIRSHVGRMTLHFNDAHLYLEHIQTTGIKPDVIYLDPMFPERQKSAKVKKDMALMQQLLPPNEDVEDLLKMALISAGKRVVLKRPGKAKQKGAKKAAKKSSDSNFLTQPADFVVPGKSCHFQVFMIN